jgi:hypothetical protein
MFTLAYSVLCLVYITCFIFYRIFKFYLSSKIRKDYCLSPVFPIQNGLKEGDVLKQLLSKLLYFISLG